MEIKKEKIKTYLHSIENSVASHQLIEIAQKFRVFILAEQREHPALASQREIAPINEYYINENTAVTLLSGLILELWDEMKFRESQEKAYNSFEHLFGKDVRRTFFIMSEQKRIRGRLSYYVGEIIPNKGMRLIDNDYTTPTQSHRGLDNEGVKVLVEKGELPKDKLDEYGYIDETKRDYILIMVEGQGLNYIQFRQ